MTLKKYEELCFSDDFLFGKILQTDPELTKELIEVILGVEISKVEIVETQKTMKFTPLDRGVRLDAYVKDDASTVYDIEMQASPEFDIGKRSRYYQGMIDLDQIEGGAMFSELNRSFVIFICKNRPIGFNKNLPVYTFSNKCKEDENIELGDQTTKVIVNAAAPMQGIDEKLKNFLKFIKEDVPVDDFTQRLYQKVKSIKEAKKWRTEYMTYELKFKESFMKGKTEGIAEGIAEGETKLSTLINILISEKRLDDIQKATTDEEYRKMLYTQYKI